MNIFEINVGTNNIFQPNTNSNNICPSKMKQIRIQIFEYIRIMKNIPVFTGTGTDTDGFSGGEINTGVVVSTTGMHRNDELNKNLLRFLYCRFFTWKIQNNCKFYNLWRLREQYLTVQNDEVLGWTHWQRSHELRHGGEQQCLQEGL